MKDQSLYYGDCLDWMREWPSESVDLIYLDPPFNSNADYNIIFGTGNGTPAQVRGFNDTWRWDEAAADRVNRFENAVAHPLHNATVALKRLLGDSGMLAYLTYMGERIVEMRRLLKPNATIYLHCDPTASHYLKMLLDAVFGARRFRNELIWKRTSSHSHAKRYGPIHDVILVYGLGENPSWNQIYESHDPQYLDKHYRHKDDHDRRYRIGDLTGAGTRKGESGLPWRGIDPTARGRHWAVPGSDSLPDWVNVDDDYDDLSIHQRLDLLDGNDLIHWPPGGAMPAFKRYLATTHGRLTQDVIVDIPPIGSRAKERLGYPTQKPVALLRRIISVSSNPGDLVLDPFCGCGTTVIAAHELERRWIGVDISATAIDIIQERRLKPLGIATDTFGIPQDLASARKLAADKPFDFEAWAVTRISGLAPNERKTGDAGVDGRGMLLDKPTDGDSKLVLAQVKGGGFQIGQLRDFLHVIERDDAVCGVFITVDPVTSGQARAEARGLGDTSVGSGRYPRAQLWSIADWFEGRRPHLPTLTDPQTGKPIQPSLLG